MKFCLTITTLDGDTLNAWCDTESQAVIIANLLTENPSASHVEIYKNTRGGLVYIQTVPRSAVRS